MGRKKLERPPVEHLYSKAMNMLVPAHIPEYFEMWDATEHRDRRVIKLREKEGRIPQALSDQAEIVSDGYSNPIEMLSHSFVCKPIWLRPYRRRCKPAGEERHYTNEYELTLQGVRPVPESGIFLKE